MQKSSIGFPKRGHFYIADLDSSYGYEMHKKRPVLVISDNIYNETTPYVVIIPSSSTIPITLGPEMVFLGKLKGFEKKSILLPLHLRSIDKRRLIKKIGALSKDKLFEVEEAVKLVLGMVELD